MLNENEYAGYGEWESIIIEILLPSVERTDAGQVYFLSILSLLIHREKLGEVGELEGMFQHAFDPEFSEKKFFQDIPACSIKVIW